MSQSLTTPKLAARLVGLTIVAVDLRPFNPNMLDTGDLRPAFDPIITFSDGSRITFMVQETEVGEYGVEIMRHVAEQSPKKKRKRNAQ